MATVPEDHACAWREKYEDLEAKYVAQHELIGGMQAQLEKLTRHVFGTRSEKVTPVAEELRQANPPTREQTLAERRAKRAARDSLPTEVVHHPVAPGEAALPQAA